MSDISPNFKNTYFDLQNTKPGGSLIFKAAKRGFDILCALSLLPLLCICALILLILNPKRNPGSLFFVQKRVGKNGRVFPLIKFRTMVGENAVSKFADQEQSRLTQFGMTLRNKRVDEVPQIINVLLGQMSFIGPRPEQEGFVAEYIAAIPGYGDRHMVRPGISGLAQVEHGYTSDVEGTRGKLHYDKVYINNSSFRMEAYVVWRTLATILTGFGAK
ncbi:MAG: sugar transferase [Planktomarina sp.]